MFGVDLKLDRSDVHILPGRTVPRITGKGRPSNSSDARVCARGIDRRICVAERLTKRRWMRRVPGLVITRCLLVFLCFSFGAVQTTAAEFQLSGNRDGNISAMLSGRIDEEDGATLRSLISMAQTKALRISQLSLNSPGGSVIAGADLAITIRKSGIRTSVDDANVCASACFMVFAAGVDRVASSRARIGVHSATSTVTGETRLAKSVTIDMARLLAEFGVPPSVLGRMVTATPNDIAWLTADELGAMTRPAKPEPTSSGYAERIAPDVASSTPARTVATTGEIQQARELTSKGLALLRASRPDDALAFLKKALTLNPFDADTAANYGEALFQSGQFAAAKDALALALRINPKRGAPYGTLALTLAAVGDVEWAKESFVNYYHSASHKDVIREQLFRWRSDSSSSPSLKRAADMAIRSLNIG